MGSYPAARSRQPVLHAATTGVADRLGAIDPLAEPLAKLIRDGLGSGTVKDALSGRWLGHALHPLLTDVVIGCMTSATLLDLIGGEESRRAAQLLVGTGLAAGGPTVASGWSDWADTSVDPEVRRLGVVHAVGNATGLGFYAASLAARRQRRRGRGALLGLAGMGLMGLGGFLGGHLSYAKGVGVNVTAFEEGPEDWTPALRLDELEEGRPATATVEGVTLLLARHDGRVVAMSDRCSHRGGALHEGDVGDGCVTCPLHGSVFNLADGSVVSGPATNPQPTYDVRVVDGRVEVRAAAAAG